MNAPGGAHEAPASSVVQAAAGAAAVGMSPMQQAPMQQAPMPQAPMPIPQASPMQAPQQAPQQAPMPQAPNAPLPASPALPMQGYPQPAAPLAAAPPLVQPVAPSPPFGGEQGAAITTHVEAAPSPAIAPRAPHAVLVAIMKDGTDGRSFPVLDDPTDLGRTEGHIILSDDPYLSPRHARLVPRPDGLLVRDLDTINGIYVRVREPVELRDGDMMLLGQQLLRFEVLPEAELPLGPATHAGVLVFGTPEVARVARLVQYTTEGVGRDVHYLYRDETTIGREQGDVVCTDDPFMSRRHAAITLERSHRRFVLRDLSSSNGSALRIRGERLLKVGDQFRVGRHLFRYDPPGALG